MLNENTVTQILKVARWAPSVHNTQPWKVKYTKNLLTIAKDPEHILEDGDPTTRQTSISMGIFAEALKIGIESVGLSFKNYRFTEQGFAITVSEARQTNSKVEQLIKDLRTRCSDRSIYKKTKISRGTIENIANCNTSKSVVVVVVTEKQTIDKVADYTSRGISLAMSNPEFRSELSQYLLQPWSKLKRGISVRSLYIPYLLAILQPKMVKYGLSTKSEAILENKRWKSASGLVFITSSGDMPEHWFEAGQCYLRVSLAIEEANLSQATSAAIVEAADFHEDVEQLISTNNRILSVIRIGRGSKKRHYSPRISADELLT